MHSKDIRNIPLFPLSVVLFPESYIKIHIFEEKFKSLYHDCIISDQQFGVSLLIEEKIFNYGCIAKIIEVLKIYDDGNVDIIVEGIQRFKLLNLILDYKPYPVGKIECFEDAIEPFQFELKNETISLYNELIKVIYQGKIDTTKISKTIKNISFKVAEKVGMTLLERQLLLETTSETERLKKIFEYLKDIIPRLDDFNIMQNIIQNDGYMQYT
jgi:uncharacterized protein